MKRFFSFRLSMKIVNLRPYIMQREITLHDKTFTLFIDENEIQASIEKLASELMDYYTDKQVILLPVLNGSFMFASDLMKQITRDIEVSFVKVSSYKGNTQTSGRVDELIGLNASVRGKHVVILEDIVDTGITIDKVISLLSADYPASIEVCTLLFKPDAYLGKHQPKFVGKAIENKFVVGYGLDYNEIGRNLKEVYQLKEE